MRLLLIASFVILSSCASLDNRFCKQSGYLSGTFSYYDCVKRYDEDPIAYEHCASVFGFIRESKKQHQCIHETVPAIRETFKNNNMSCKNRADKRFSVQSMHPLKTLKIVTLDENSYVVDSEVVPGNTNVYQIVNERKKRYIESCIKEYGWQKHLKFLHI